jgi:hypothetical protein
MFAVVQQLNAMKGMMNNLTAQVANLNEQVKVLSDNQKNSSESNLTVKVNQLNDGVDELKKTLNKIQIDVVGKHNEVKKDVENTKKEIKLLETTMGLKFEQNINKTVKDRTDIIANELKTFVERTITECVDGSDKETEKENVNEQD